MWDGNLDLVRSENVCNLVVGKLESSYQDWKVQILSAFLYFCLIKNSNLKSQLSDHDQTAPN